VSARSSTQGAGRRPQRAAARPAARPRREQPLEHRILVTATLCLIAFGAVMVYSASSGPALLAHQGDGTGALLKYLSFAGIGLLLMHVLARVGLEPVRRAAPLLLAVCFGLLLVTLVPGIGVQVNGARRWIGAGPLRFQPSELMKLALVLYAVGLLHAQPRRIRTLGGICNPLLVVAGGACLLIVAQPDLGTALVISFTLAAVLVAAGTPLRYLAGLAVAGAVLVALLALVEPYRVARLTAFVNPWADAQHTGFQSVQGQIALGSGGLFGVGLGQGVAKLFYLPEHNTDFILGVIGEELGAAGICALLFLYGLVAYAGLRTAKAARDGYAKLLAAGLTALILCQALLNVFTVLGLAPVTGVPLPFISAGSSSLVVLLAAMGLLLSVASGRGSAAARPRLRAVQERGPDQRRAERDADRDRRGRDRGARRAGARGGRRAAG